MNEERVKKLIYLVVELIPDEEIKNYTYIALDSAPKEFFLAPASSSGKHHPPENNLTGGLLGVHTLKCALYGHDFSEHSNPKLKGIVMSACILHDIQKGVDENGIWKGYAFDHALKAYNWLGQFDLREDYKDRIRNAVRTHMSDLTSPDNERVLATSPNLDLVQRIVQLADGAASAMWASFIPGVNTKALLELRTNDSLQTLDDLMNLENLENGIKYLWKNRL